VGCLEELHDTFANYWGASGMNGLSAGSSVRFIEGDLSVQWFKRIDKFEHLTVTG